MKYPRRFAIVPKWDNPNIDLGKIFPDKYVEATLNRRTKRTKAYRSIIFNNLEEGEYVLNAFIKDWGADERIITVKGENTHEMGIWVDRCPHFELSTDKTELKKGETCIIEAKASETFWEHTPDNNQIIFYINDTQTVISDYDYDNHTAVMTYVATGAGKVQITAKTTYNKYKKVYSNVLSLQDGV